MPAETSLGGSGISAGAAGTAALWAPVCAAARLLVSGDEDGIRQFYEAWFTAYRVETPGLFTGYYEPEVRGALAQAGIYQTPLLARPDDLIQFPVTGRMDQGKLVAYWSRAEIEAGQMGAQARPLLWLADPVDLFFLQIQGAGRVRLSDGTIVRVVYDGKNGRPYTPIGRVLVQRQALAANNVSMQSIRAWLDANPDQAGQVMDQNQDYVFFRVLTDADPQAGPPGALGVKLAAGRSAAVDRYAVPLGTPIFIDTTDPISGAAWRHLLLAQDVGSDITGPARADVFLGAGLDAERVAGAMRQGGTEYVLLPKQSP